jgi:hypothetical protein
LAVAGLLIGFLIPRRHSGTIASFSASKVLARAGEPVQLCYVTKNGRSIAIAPSPGPILFTDSGCVTVKPTSPTTYTLTVTDADGRTARQVVTVQVLPRPAAPRIVSFNSSRESIRPGGTAKLCYTVEGAEHVTIDPELGTHTGRHGCLDVSPALTRRYTLYAYGAGKTRIARDVTVAVATPAPASTPTPAPTRTAAPTAVPTPSDAAARAAVTNFQITPTSVSAGTTITLCISIDSRGNPIAVLTPRVGRLQNLIKCYYDAPPTTTTYKLTVRLGDSYFSREQTVEVHP